MLKEEGASPSHVVSLKTAFNKINLLYASKNLQIWMMGGDHRYGARPPSKCDLE